MKKDIYVSQWHIFWEQFKKNKIGFGALCLFFLFLIVALYAPFLASSKPLVVYWEGKMYFPLFRYLFYSNFFSKPIDLFFNVLMFTFPLALLGLFFLKQEHAKKFLVGLVFIQFALFALFLGGVVKNPESNLSLKEARSKAGSDHKKYHEDPLLAPVLPPISWDFELSFFSPYEKLNMLFRYKLRKNQHERLLPFTGNSEKPFPTLWAVDQKNEIQKKQALEKTLLESQESYRKAFDALPTLVQKYLPFSHEFIMAKYDLDHTAGDMAEKEKRFNELVKEALSYRMPLIEAKRIVENYEGAAAELNFIKQRALWLEDESQKMWTLFPLFRNFHWEDDAGGSQMINRKVPWWELSRINRKDLVASLIFGVRVSIIVASMAVSISLFIGIVLGMLSGYFAGKTDLIICRLIEIWEAMPIFFMLLLIVAITQSKSLFIVIMVLGLFGWTSKARFMRGEVLKQRNLPYVLACKSLGFKNGKIMFSHILPNAIPPILTLLPFSMMAAITSEAGLSFLGLGEEGSTSWGVLMDEGRSVFPAESYLLWPPAILLSLLLVSIALIGDALRDAIDPKMRS